MATWHRCRRSEHCKQSAIRRLPNRSLLVVVAAQIKLAKGYALLAVPLVLAGAHVQAEEMHLEKTTPTHHLTAVKPVTQRPIHDAPPENTPQANPENVKHRSHGEGGRPSVQDCEGHLPASSLGLSCPTTDLFFQIVV